MKTVRNALRSEQLVEHLRNLNAPDADERLFVVTPDASEPGVIAHLSDPRVVWFNFRSLSDSIDALLSDPSGLVGEQTRFLMRELQALLVEDGLLDTDDVVVVAARRAYREYLTNAAYVCQPGRSFREGLTHMGFYTDGAIQSEIPRIVMRFDKPVVFSSDEAARLRAGSEIERRLADVIDQLGGGRRRKEGEPYQVFLLTSPTDSETIRLERSIKNDTLAQSGRPFAWTLGQRYVALSRLLRPGIRVTSDLDRS